MRCFDFCRTWMATPQPGARVLGAHLESPYVSPAQKGALDPAAMRTPDDGSVDALLAYADVLRIFVLAPELPGALDLVAPAQPRSGSSPRWGTARRRMSRCGPPCAWVCVT